MKNFVILCSVLLIISCKKEKKENLDLGIVTIEVSGNKDAIPYFEKGLLLLHSFEYDDAREAFLLAQEKDPEMVMAYWGEAMTYNHSLWNEQDYEKANITISRLNAIDHSSKTSQLEQDLIEAIRILYQANTTKNERDKNYSNYMEELTIKYPSNHEVSAFYALSLLGASADGRDEGLYGKGAKVAQAIIAVNPKHPGALHYLIHSYDDPNHAHLALDAADAYAKVAPDASHALHMPSHIYIAKGMWDKVISSNIDSYQASLNRMNQKSLDNDARGYHAFHWLEYGYLQKENKEKAKNMVREMYSFMEELPSKRARSHMVFLKGTYLVETDDWTSDISDIKVDITDLNVSIRSQYHYLEGMKAYKNQKFSRVDSIIKVMENDLKRETYVASSNNSKLCSSISRDEATKSDLTEAKIRLNQLLALQAINNGNKELANGHFLETINLNSTLTYSFGPPFIQKPVHEMYADWLVTENQIEKAKSFYKAALQNAPKRLISLKGIEKIESF